MGWRMALPRADTIEPEPPEPVEESSASSDRVE